MGLAHDFEQKGAVFWVGIVVCESQLNEVIGVESEQIKGECVDGGFAFEEGSVDAGSGGHEVGGVRH